MTTVEGPPAQRRATYRASGQPKRGRFPVRTSLVIGCVALLGWWWLGTPAGAVTTPGGAVLAFGELAGLLGSFLVVAQLLLVARVPWFERSVGFDRLVSWHRSLGTSVVLLVVSHALAMVVGGMFVDNATPWDEVMAMLRTYPDMLTALAGTTVFVVVGMSGARVFRRRLSYEWWFLIHLTVYGGVFLAFFHQVSAGAHLARSPMARAAWIALYAATAAAVIWYRALVPAVRFAFSGMRVEQVVREAAGTTSVWLHGRNVDRLGGTAGQFFLVRFLARGHLLTAHPYSLSVVPADRRVRFTIGALGDHSGAVRRLRPGTWVFLEGPFGRFTAERARSSRVLLVAGGAGIGPVRALAEHLYSGGRDVVVVHRAHSADHLALSGEFTEVDRLRYVPLPGRRVELGYDPLSPHRLGLLVPDVKRRDVFICGPEGMTTTVVRALRALGVPRSAIHTEELSLA
ncbi:ferredoxin reductase family protein [Cellulomonas sp. McL0617]|uniref:ferredoxin reductase family protein n=1 Tax=Cellulomonas sp. McL0617 TaxID=3415675 RepID=UPI003CFA0D30